MSAWYAKVFLLKKDSPGHLALELGLIDDSDITYFNGAKIGETGNLIDGHIAEYPLDTVCLYWGMLAYKGIWRQTGAKDTLRLAIDYGERCRVRTPENLNNLISLSDAYLLSGNSEKALHTAENAKLTAPDDSRVSQLFERLNPQNGSTENTGEL